MEAAGFERWNPVARVDVLKDSLVCLPVNQWLQNHISLRTGLVSSHTRHLFITFSCDNRQFHSRTRTGFEGGECLDLANDFRLEVWPEANAPLRYAKKGTPATLRKRDSKVSVDVVYVSAGVFYRTATTLWLLGTSYCQYIPNVERTCWRTLITEEDDHSFVMRTYATTMITQRKI